MRTVVGTPVEVAASRTPLIHTLGHIHKTRVETTGAAMEK